MINEWAETYQQNFFKLNLKLNFKTFLKKKSKKDVTHNDTHGKDYARGRAASKKVKGFLRSFIAWHDIIFLTTETNFANADPCRGPLALLKSGSRV